MLNPGQSTALQYEHLTTHSPGTLGKALFPALNPKCVITECLVLLKLFCREEKKLLQSLKFSEQKHLYHFSNLISLFSSIGRNLSEMWFMVLRATYLVALSVLSKSETIPQHGRVQ